MIDDIAQERERPTFAESALVQQTTARTLGEFVDAQTQRRVVKRIYMPLTGKGRGHACVYIHVHVYSSR